MKKSCILVLILIILLLSSCASVHVSYRLSNSNSIDIGYVLILSDNESSKHIDTIEAYWTQMGFATNVDLSDGATTLSGQRDIICKNKQQAANEFSALLTDTDSFFEDVTFVYAPSFEEDSYSLEASVSLVDIIRQNEAQNIPDDEITALHENAHSGKYSLSIELPGEVVETNADEQLGQACTWTLAYGEVTHISIKTKKINRENIAHYADLNNAYQRDGLIISLSCAAAGAMILAIILTLFIRRWRRKRVSKVRIKKFR